MYMKSERTTGVRLSAAAMIVIRSIVGYGVGAKVGSAKGCDVGAAVGAPVGTKLNSSQAD